MPETTTAPLQCRVAFDAPSAPAPDMMYMPAGQHDINVTQGGEPRTVTVMVTPQSAVALEKQRLALEAKGKRPYFDLNHDDEEASFWPVSFYWKDSPAPGVYVRGEWSDIGAAAIAGKRYRQFSPMFHVDSVFKTPALVACRTDAKPNMGGLVNDPAFKKILPLWAKENAGAHSSGNQTNKQEVSTMEPKELAALQAKNTELQNELNALKAKADKTALDEQALIAKEAEIKSVTLAIDNATLKAKNAEMETSIKARNATDAKVAVEAAVARGAIAAKDSETQKAWEQDITENPARAALLAKMAGNPALGARITDPAAGRVEVGDTRVGESMKALGALMAKQTGAHSLEEKSRIARDAAALFAKDVRSQKDWQNAPLSAADSTDANLGILSGTLVTQRTLEDFKLNLLPSEFISTDFSDQPAQYGQVTNTRIVVVPAVDTYDPTLDANGYPVGYKVTTPAITTDAAVTLNNHKAVSIVFGANQLSGTVRRLFDEQQNLQGYALAKAANDALLGVITVANYTTNTAVKILAADFGRPAFAQGARILNKLGAPVMNRCALVNSDYFERLTQDPTLVSLAVFQKPEIITGAELPAINKFQPLEAPNLPTTGNLAAFFMHRSALVLQTRLPQDYTTALPGASYGNTMVVTDPDTGLSMLMVQYVNHNGGYAAARLAMLFGVAKGNEKGGWIVKSA
jgi:hypothetical protein